MMDIFKQKEVKKEKEPRRLESSDTQTCPFCGGRNIRGGSWSPDTCTDCRAVYFFGAWWEW